MNLKSSALLKNGHIVQFKCFCLPEVMLVKTKCLIKKINKGYCQVTTCNVKNCVNLLSFSLLFQTNHCLKKTKKSNSFIHWIF